MSATNISSNFIYKPLLDWSLMAKSPLCNCATVARPVQLYFLCRSCRPKMQLSPRLLILKQGQTIKSYFYFSFIPSLHSKIYLFFLNRDSNSSFPDQVSYKNSAKRGVSLFKSQDTKTALFFTVSLNILHFRFCMFIY